MPITWSLTMEHAAFRYSIGHWAQSVKFFYFSTGCLIILFALYQMFYYHSNGIFRSLQSLKIWTLFYELKHIVNFLGLFFLLRALQEQGRNPHQFRASCHVFIHCLEHKSVGNVSFRKPWPCKGLYIVYIDLIWKSLKERCCLWKGLISCLCLQYGMFCKIST